MLPLLREEGDALEAGSSLRIVDLHLLGKRRTCTVYVDGERRIELAHDLSAREVAVVRAGGRIAPQRTELRRQRPQALPSRA